MLRVGTETRSFASIAELRDFDSARSIDHVRVMQALFSALAPLYWSRGSRSIPLPYVMVFLAVAIDEGKGNNDYARDLGIERHRMARYFRDVGPEARNGCPGLGLIEIKQNPKRSQKNKIVLTAKGRGIVDKILKELGRLGANPYRRRG